MAAPQGRTTPLYPAAALAKQELHTASVAASETIGDAGARRLASARRPSGVRLSNADTPTAVFEAAVFQWYWLEDGLSRGFIPRDGDQFNSIHEKLVARWRDVAKQKLVHFVCMKRSAEDFGTVSYLEDCAKQAGFSTDNLDMSAIGLRGCTFVDLLGRSMQSIFKLYPWEFMLADEFGRSPAMANTQFIEPPWKMLLSNKGMLAYLWEMEPGHPNLLPTFFDHDARAADLGPDFARKPIWSREGANVTLVEAGRIVGQSSGTYGAEGYVRQALVGLPAFDGNFPVVGSWLVGDEAAGMGIREDVSRITTDRARFVHHIIG
jgi:glutathionylspermidine synthase